MKAQIVFLFLFFVVACKNERSSPLKDMQSDIDSASAYYDSCILALEHGETIPIVKEKYERKILHFRNCYKTTLDSLGKQFINHKIDSTQYEMWISSLQTDSITIKSNYLEKIGLELDIDSSSD